MEVKKFLVLKLCFINHPSHGEHYDLSLYNCDNYSTNVYNSWIKVKLCVHDGEVEPFLICFCKIKLLTTILVMLRVMPLIN